MFVSSLKSALPIFISYSPADFKEKTAAQGLTEYEAIILASIVQKETYNVFEAPIVASVYYNRLNIDMILQADPTILYGKFLRGEYEIKIGKADLRDETNIYNTYKHKGNLLNFYSHILLLFLHTHY